ncbi:MAG: hypothetical protein LBH93_03390, partial [Chitinispirillales bacterium]|nr:hypothetical protein [Chitinispirillales bacterium]
MLKFKNFFLMGLMVAAVGMFGLACETDPVDPIEPEAYTATIIGGYFFEDEFTPPWSSPTYYYEGDTVNIFAA